MRSSFLSSLRSADAQPSATLRDVGKHVMRAFGDVTGEGAIQLLVDVLRREPQDEDDEDDEDMDEDDDDDDDEDRDMAGIDDC